MKRFLSVHRVITAVLAGSLLAFAGCKQEKVYVMGKVSGRVVLDGNPVKEGCVVVMHPIGGDTLHGSGVIAEDGKFVISLGTGQLGVPVGEYAVTISPPPLAPEVQNARLEEKTE